MIRCTQDMENINLSPTMSSKLRNRQNANRIRHGSPKLQEVLREKCRQKMREKRGQLYNRSRFGLEIDSTNVRNTLSEIVRSELSDLATRNLDPTVNPFSPVVSAPLSQEEALELENEIINEEEQWILQEYEKMLEEEVEFMALIADSESDEVICPMCQAFNLAEEANEIVCNSCCFILKNGMSKKEFGYHLRTHVNNHSRTCNEPPGFSPLEEGNNTCLYLVCDKCSTLTPIL